MSVLAMPIEELLASVGDRPAALRALGAVAVASSDPQANITDISERMRRLREKLMPAGLSGRLGLTASLPSEPAAYMPFVPGDLSGCGFSQVSLSPRLWTKEVVREGTWVHPLWDERVEFDRIALDAISRSTNGLLASVLRIPCPDGHRFDASANLAWALATWTEPTPEGDKTRLMSLLDVPSEEVAKRLGKEHRDVSMFLEPEARDSRGNVFRNAITHIAFTDYPVIDRQTTFAPLELARDGKKVTVQVLVPAAFSRPLPSQPQPPNGDHAMPMSDKGLAALGFARDAKPTDAEIEAKTIELSSRNLTLTAERDEARRKADAFAKVEADRDAAELDQLITDTKASACASKNPAAFGPAEQERVKRLWGAGLKEDARAFASLAGGQKPALAAGATPFVPPATADEAAKRANDIQAQEKRAHIHGYSTRREGSGATAKLFAKKGTEEICLVG